MEAPMLPTMLRGALACDACGGAHRERQCLATALENIVEVSTDERRGLRGLPRYGS
jgi:hypothetical protein